MSDSNASSSSRKGCMHDQRADRAANNLNDSSRRLDEALALLNDRLDVSSGVPIAELSNADSLVTSVDELMKSTRAHRPERRAVRAARAITSK